MVTSGPKKDRWGGDLRSWVSESEGKELENLAYQCFGQLPLTAPWRLSRIQTVSSSISRSAKSYEPGHRHLNSVLLLPRMQIGAQEMPEAYESYQFSLKREEELERPAVNSRLDSLSSTNLNHRDHSSNGSANNGSANNGSAKLSIALIGPDEDRRKALAGTLAGFQAGEVSEFSSYPPALDNVPKMLDRYYDVIIIDLDSDPEYALELVESIRDEDSATVMVYSAAVDQQLMFQCIRAGAREFLIPPFDQSAIFEALTRAAQAPRPEVRRAKKTRGKLLVFLGTKGGSGVTTVACNFAIALGQESGQSTLLVDLGLPLGDAALNLGIVADFSTDHAFQDVDRLDGVFLSKLLAKHRTGISVLAAPSKVPKVQASSDAIEKLMKAARQEFENVIVDVGSRLDLIGTALFNEASTVYLVTQAGISELRNSNRILTEFFNQSNPKLEVVINHYEPNSQGLTDEHITKALNRPVKWKIPNNYAAVRQMQDSATPVTLVDSPVSRPIRQMARSASGLPPLPEKTLGFRLRSLARNGAEKVSITEEPQASSDVTATVAWSAPESIVYGAKLDDIQLNATASVSGKFAYTPGDGYMLPAGTHTLWVTFTPADAPGSAPVQAAVSITVTKATPAIKWPAPGVIACGTPLSNIHLNATASVPGKFAYTLPAGEVLTAGKHELSVTFTPIDAANYAPAQATVSVTVAKAPPTTSWPEPAPITSGTALGDDQLNATASVPGKFAYTPPAGELLAAGTHVLQVVFTPEDTSGYTTVKASVELTVVKSTPVIAWPAPEPVPYGTKLSSTQLSATASVPGTFTYTPGEGAILGAGTHTPIVTFTPKDSSSYGPAQAAVSLIVNKVDPAVAWKRPAPISDETPLTVSQLNATASVPGTFVYTPAAGQTLPLGTHSLAVTFTPMDPENFSTVQSTVSITVTKATPTTIKWETPATIPYGTPLSVVQLNATSLVPGNFVYSPGAGEVLTAGRHKLHVRFIPADTVKYAPAQSIEVIEVEEVPDLDSLLDASTQTPFEPTETKNQIDLVDANSEEPKTKSAGSQDRKLQTRVYKGAIYERGEDGQWHLQRK
jgi:Flp pilus assembly CpaE family ATPase